MDLGQVNSTKLARKSDHETDPVKPSRKISENEMWCQLKKRTGIDGFQDYCKTWAFIEL